MEVKKRRPNKNKLSPYQIPIKLEFDIVIPDKKDIVAKGSIVLSEETVDKILVEEI